jgi:hypothetical protein
VTPDEVAAATQVWLRAALRVPADADTAARVARYALAGAALLAELEAAAPDGALHDLSPEAFDRILSAAAART